MSCPAGAPAARPASDELILKEFEGLESPLEEPRPFRDRDEATEYVLTAVADWAVDHLQLKL